MRSLIGLARRIDGLNEIVGRSVSWIALAMVLLQVAIVLMRYVFGIGSILLQESMLYMHATLFMAAAGYTLAHDGHVRIDIFYRAASPRAKAAIDLAGAMLLLLPVCALILWISWPYVSSSWKVLEGSKETNGIPAVFLLKSLIYLFAVLVGLQGVSMAVRAACILAGLPWPSADAAEDGGT